MMTVDDMREALAHLEALEPEDRVDLEAAVKRLKPLYRNLLVLRAMGYTNREAMKRAGCSDPWTLYRAERALMKELACDE